MMSFVELVQFARLVQRGTFLRYCQRQQVPLEWAYTALFRRLPPGSHIARERKTDFGALPPGYLTEWLARAYGAPPKHGGLRFQGTQEFHRSSGGPCTQPIPRMSASNMTKFTECPHAFMTGRHDELWVKAADAQMACHAWIYRAGQAAVTRDSVVDSAIHARDTALEQATASAMLREGTVTIRRVRTHDEDAYVVGPVTTARQQKVNYVWQEREP